MIGRKHALVWILLLLAVMCGCTNSLDHAINNPSGDSTEKSVSADTRPVAAWPPPAAQPTPIEAPAPLLPSRILTKDAEYRGLIKPPGGDEFLKLYSNDYNARMAEVEARINNINDKALRDKARTDAWKNVDKAGFQQQATEAHLTKFREYMAKHRDGWVELGHCEYDPSTEMLKVFSIPASPFQGTDKFDVHMDVATMDAVYNKFRTVADNRILARIDQDVMEYFAQEESPAYSREQVTKFLRVQRYKTYESRIRLEQMVVIGKGDLADKDIQHVSIVDYATETVLLDLDPEIFKASHPSWLY
jgi:hypothetical protein